MFSPGNISSSSSVATSALSSTAMTSSMTDIDMSSSSSGVNSTNSSSSSSSSKTGAELTFLAGLPSAAEYEDIAVECPTIFYIDSDNECQHCPSGGVCPADARGQVFAIEGYWQKDTFAAPIRCPMGATACAGTDVDAVYKGDVVAAAGCNEGYEGYACADCAEDYSKNFLACEVCPVGTLGILDIVLRFLSPIICLVLLMFASAFAHPKYVISTASTIVLLQRIVVMGQQASMELGSPALAAFFSYCSVINWDMSVTRPDCNVAAFTAITYFWSSCILILAAHISCHFMIAVRVYILKPPQDPLQKAAVYKLRASVASASITIMTYMRIIQVIAQGIVCVEDSEGGVSRLAVDPNVVCYTGAHMVAVGVMYLILIVLGLCFPVFLYKSARAYSQLKIANAGLDTRMANRIGTLDEPKHVFDVWLTYYKKDGLWFLFVVYAGSFCIALQGALASSASVRTFIVGSIIVGDSIVAILMKPYTKKLLYIRKVLLCTTAVVMQASFIVVLAFSNIHTGTQTQNLVLASLVCVLLIGYLAYSFWAIQIKQDLMGTPVDTDRIVVKIKQKEDFELPA
jgi:hypothetical protein